MFISISIWYLHTLMRLPWVFSRLDNLSNQLLLLRVTFQAFTHFCTPTVGTACQMSLTRTEQRARITFLDPLLTNTFWMESKRLICYKHISGSWSVWCAPGLPGPFLQSCLYQPYLVHGACSSPGAELDISLLLNFMKFLSVKFSILLRSYWMAPDDSVTPLSFVSSANDCSHRCKFTPILYAFWHFYLNFLVPWSSVVDVEDDHSTW